MFKDHKIVSLTHFINNETPGYGGASGFKKEHASQICCGSSANSIQFEFSTNHIGTHIDLPYHFDNEGKKMHNYSASEWFFSEVFFIDFPCEAGTMIGKDVFSQVPDTADAVILKTHFEQYRGEDVYWENNPGVLPEAGEFLRQERPSVKLIGFDFISLTCYQNREVGRIAHRTFLEKKHPGEPVLIVEDMMLHELTSSPKGLVVSPLMIETSDGGPVSVYALF